MIKILGHQYQYIVDNKLGISDGTAGQCCPGLLRITIDPSVPVSRQEEALLHEIFEALIYHLGCQKEISHQVMTSLSEALYAVMKDNPEYFVFRIPSVVPDAGFYPGKINQTKEKL